MIRPYRFIVVLSVAVMVSSFVAPKASADHNYYNDYGLSRQQTSQYLANQRRENSRYDSSVRQRMGQAAQQQGLNSQPRIEQIRQESNNHYWRQMEGNGVRLSPFGSYYNSYPDYYCPQPSYVYVAPSYPVVERVRYVEYYDDYDYCYNPRPRFSFGYSSGGCRSGFSFGFYSR